MDSNYHTKITLQLGVCQKSAEGNDILSLPRRYGFQMPESFAKNLKARTRMVPAPASIWLNHRTDMGFSPDREGDLLVGRRDYCVTF
jgi:hypothetical protein